MFPRAFQKINGAAIVVWHGKNGSPCVSLSRQVVEPKGEKQIRKIRNTLPKHPPETTSETSFPTSSETTFLHTKLVSKLVPEISPKLVFLYTKLVSKLVPKLVSEVVSEHVSGGFFSRLFIRFPELKQLILGHFSAPETSSETISETISGYTTFLLRFSYSAITIL